jgi:uncharacterized membrane protein YphA (DoxX/SURF4 family)
VQSLVISPVGSIAAVARMVLGVTFLLSGYAKLRDLDGLTFGILRYQILPPRVAWPLARPLAYLLTVTELGLGVLLLTGILAHAAALGSVVLLGCFAWAVGLNLHRGRPIPCNCLTSSPEERIGPMTMARLAVLGAAGVFVALATRAGAPVGRTMAASLEVAVWQVSMAAAVAALVLLMDPATVLWHNVLEARQAEVARRQAEADLRQAREALLAHREARRHERWRMRADAQVRARLAAASAMPTADLPLPAVMGDALDSSLGAGAG